MKIKVKVKANARTEGVSKLPDGSYVVAVKAPAIEGRANKNVIEVLSGHFNKPKRSFEILTGITSKIKIIEIS